MNQTSLQQCIRDLANHRQTSQMIEHLHNTLEDAVETIIKICEVPAPSFHEGQRAQLVKKMMSNLADVQAHVDEHNNVIGRYEGKCSEAKIAVSAHIDTVFPPDTEISVKKENDTLTAPGIGDNSTSVGGMLHLMAAWNEFGYTPPFDVIFLANSCEEGLGDLEGIKAFLDNYAQRNDVDLQAMCILDGRMGGVINAAVGSRRLEVSLEAAGGHSWKDFGCTSAIHTMGSIIDHISQIEVPKSPRTTFNVGVVEGGTSVNTIAETASMLIDMRSVEPDSLKRLEGRVRKIISRQVQETGCEGDITVVGDRPVGSIQDDHPLVNLAQEAGRYLGLPMNTHTASTDANVPLSRGIPAITVGIYRGQGAHRKGETMHPSSLKRGLPLALLVVLSAVNWVHKLR